MIPFLQLLLLRQPYCYTALVPRTEKEGEQG